MNQSRGIPGYAGSQRGSASHRPSAYRVLRSSVYVPEGPWASRLAANVALSFATSRSPAERNAGRSEKAACWCPAGVVTRDAPHPGSRVPFRPAWRRRVPSVVRRRVPLSSCGHLPDRALGLEPLAGDAHRILALEPRPERQRDFGERTIADVLTGERVLMHLRPEIPRVDRDDADARIAQFVCERLAQELERGLATPIGAPPRIAAARRVTRDVHDEASRWFQDRKACVDQCERSDDVDLVDASKDLKRVLHERRERGRTQFGGVVDQEVETTGAAERGDQVASVLLLCHISVDGRNGCAGGLEALHGLEQRTFVTGREDQRPPLSCEKLGDGVSEPATRPGDQRDAFGWTVSVMRRTLRHGHPRPAAIYLGSRLQNLQTVHACPARLPLPVSSLWPSGSLRNRWHWTSGPPRKRSLGNFGKRRRFRLRRISNPMSVRRFQSSA